jgi:hypothetical protein
MRRAVGILIVSATALAQEPMHYPPTLVGQLERLSAEFPCEGDDDTWKLTRRHRPPPRVPCTFTASSEASMRTLFRVALENVDRLPVTEVRQDAAGHAGEPYVFSGRVRGVFHDSFYSTHVWITVGDAQEIEVVFSDYSVSASVGAVVDVVGYLAGWSERGDEQVPVMAGVDLLAPGEISRLMSGWSHPSIPRGQKRRWRWSRAQ